MIIYLKRLKSSKFVRVKAFPMYGGIGVSAPSLHRDWDRGGWPASLPYIQKIRVSVAIGNQSRIRLHERVPMVKYGGPQKMTKIGPQESC